MATWRFNDGSELSSGGIVRGNGAAAIEMRLVLVEDPAPVVQVAPRPMKPISLDVGSDYLLDVFAQALAFELRQSVRSDYERSDDDAPPEARALLAAAIRGGFEDPSGTVY